MENKLLKILKLRKQLKYLDNLDDILCDNDDGGLYDNLNNIEKEIKKEETQYIKNNI